MFSPKKPETAQNFTQEIPSYGPQLPRPGSLLAIERSGLVEDVARQLHLGAQPKACDSGISGHQNWGFQVV